MTARREFVGHHGVAAVLDHDGLAGEFLDIGQGFHKRPRLLCVGGHRNINSFLENRRDSAGGGGVSHGTRERRL